jgi:lactate dehydrogenase-like 2-hydroxyacid dehydrogenase
MIDEEAILAALKQNPISTFKIDVCEYSEAIEAVAFLELGDRKLVNEVVNEVLYLEWVINFSECVSPPIKVFFT